MRPWASPLSYFRLALGAAVVLGVLAPPAMAQGPTRPYREWRTLETPHFRFHYPLEFESWTRDVATHMEAVDSAVAALVGYQPPARVDVVVDDPYNEPNGSALPFFASPVLNFWPVPPAPREDIGNWRSWGEMLSVHEFAHLAHLMRPSRNPLDARFWELAPVDLGPVALKTPRWAVEGYATYVEGRITGSGRPNNAWRAAVLRQWALEGHLPTYDQMSAWDAFDGGDFAYLAGSAFLQWLAARAGDSSLVHVWRRASARVDRSFDDAFAGVFGEAPRVLYGRFTAQLTAQATDAERALEAGGLVQGALVQHLDWQTGDPAIAPDGTRLAVVVRSATQPPRLVIWPTAAPPDTAADRRDRELLARDPEDVAPVRGYPAPRTALATLDARSGRGFVMPRFMPGGQRLLVTHDTRQGDGTLRPDLYLWTPASGEVRRVTVDAAVQDADPSPDGRTALATQCTRGACDVVRVDVATGTVTTLLAGSPTRSYDRPRFAPDGGRFVVSVSDRGRWRLAIGNVDGGAPRYVGPDDRANRFDAVFRSNADTLVYASDRGGVIDLVELSLAGGVERALTRVTGAAVAPAIDAADGSIWYLALHARGYDLRRLAADSAAGSTVELTGRFGAATPPREDLRPAMPAGKIAGPYAYDLGARHTRWIPAASFGPDGFAASAYLTNLDVIGRLDLLAGGAYGARPEANGAVVAAAWRGSRVELDAAGHWSRRLPSAGSIGNLEYGALDASRAGGVAAAALAWTGDQWQWRGRAGFSAERLSLSEAVSPLGRTDAFVESDATVQQSSGRRALAERLTVHADGGRTGTDNVSRVIVRGSIGASGYAPLPAIVSVAWGRMQGSALATERFSAGGLPSPLVDSSLDAARLPVAALPTGAIVPAVAGTASSLLSYRVSVPMGVLAPYWQAVAIGGSGGYGRWHRVTGIEAQLSGAAIPTAYLSGYDVRVGVARSLDAPYASRASAYVQVRLIP